MIRPMIAFGIVIARLGIDISAEKLHKYGVRLIV